MPIGPKSDEQKALARKISRGFFKNTAAGEESAPKGEATPDRKRLLAAAQKRMSMRK